ncbi:DUF5686 and carboxypeptidase-like regulatory domain-containing protein [Arcicella rosea]|uniref:CarboxypepD_reg-like domain-containing protein n=1 Tax=Arcicella rosea TaxID=502909 RepID=A0A841ELJ9_9BACT|nr:DUF5686 and carboxypeptidase-like regulatory domain-containing protein [Arcicella rosea]MBB6001903.1 hypothetical protein [Arcicella rosea]
MSAYFKILKPLLVLTLLVLTVSSVFAQTTRIKGKVIDAKTGETLPFVNVSIMGTKQGTQTDMNGSFYLETPQLKPTLRVAFVGYSPEVREIDGGKIVSVTFKLKTQNTDLQEVTVKGKKDKYRNKDNPAVVLIRKVIEHKAQNRKESLDFYQYNKYEKLEFDLSNVSEKFRNKRSLRKFDFVFNHLDTSQITGKVNLPMYLKETISDVYFRKLPENKKEVIKGEKMTGLGNYVDNNGIKLYLEALYQDVNVYDNNILLLATQFLGPTAPVSPQFYRYVIIDTTAFKGTKCVNLGFSPRNSNDQLFQGTMLISLDSSYAIRKVQMGFSKDINVNFVTDLRVSQEYDFIENEGLMLTKDDLAIEFNLLKKENGMGLFGQRSVSYKDYIINKTIEKNIFEGLKTDIQKDAEKRDDAFWEQARHHSLSSKELGIYSMVDSVKKVPAFQRVMNTATFLLEGYKPMGGFEIGPVNTFYSFNPIEGFRARIGGRTTPTFSERMAFETYAAYGFRDERYKYFASATFSLTDHNTYTYPIKHFRISYQNEIKIPGQELQFVQEDNFLLSFKRGQNNKMTYNKVLNLDYLNESKTGLTVNINFKNIRQTPTGSLYFNTLQNDGTLKSAPEIISSELMIGLRYAPNEQFYQGKNYRIPIINKYPSFQIRYTLGVKGLLDGQYNFHRLVAYAQKRIYIPPIGYTDVALEGGKTFNPLPFALLTIHRANQTYAYQPEAYNLMNFLEFVSDQYAAVFIDHHFNGFIFNKLPIIRKLKLREVITFKGLMGKLSEQNKATAENGLLVMPTDENGKPSTFSLEKKPYMEVSFGIENIFKVLRLDLVKRLSYLENPNVSASPTIRFRMRFDF